MHRIFSLKRKKDNAIYLKFLLSKKQTVEEYRSAWISECVFDVALIDTLQMSSLKIFKEIEQDPKIGTTRRCNMR